MTMPISNERPHLPEIAKFPLMVKSAETPRSIANMELAIELLRTGLTKGEIANARYADAKHFLARAVEICWRHWVWDKWPRDYEKLGISHETSFKHMTSWFALSDIKRIPAKVAALRKTGATDRRVLDALENAEAVAKELRPIHESLEWLKGRCVKLKRSAESNPVEEILPQATLEARQLVRAAMSDALEKVRADYLAYMKTSVRQQAAAFGDEIAWKDRERLAYADQQIIAAAFDSVSGRGNVMYRLRRDADARLVKYAGQLVSSVIEMFLAKNVEKIAAIIELKQSGRPDIELRRAEVQGRTLLTAMTFAFSDSSKFEVRNSIVHSTSGHGTPYVRYPTTFHHVVLANGDDMTSPSEEEMKTSFVEGAAASSPKS
jgi:hypothetical protein